MKRRFLLLYLGIIRSKLAMPFIKKLHQRTENSRFHAWAVQKLFRERLFSVGCSVWTWKQTYKKGGVRAIKNLEGKVGRIPASILKCWREVVGKFSRTFQETPNPVRFFHASSAEPGISGSLMLGSQKTGVVPKMSSRIITFCSSVKEPQKKLQLLSWRLFSTWHEFVNLF